MSLRTIHGARQVLLLNGFVVGYKTLYGDDTYPLLTDWRSGDTLRLYPVYFVHHRDELLENIHVCLFITYRRKHCYDDNFKEPLFCHAGLAR